MADDNTYTQSSASVHKKVWEVIKASKKDFKGVGGRGKYAEFGKQGAFTTRDPNFAKEIQQRYGYAKGGSRDVVVVERDEYDVGHSKKVWLNPAMPWHKED